MDADLLDPSRADTPVAVGRYPSLAGAEQNALVVLALGRPCWILPDGGGFVLAVEPADEPAVGAELAAFAAEETERRPASPFVLPWAGAPGLALSLLAALALVAAFLWQQHDPALAARGANSSVAVFGAAEWWRPLTALLLHADGRHLLGNVVGGVCFLTLVIHALGRWLGLALVLAAGVAGNLLAAWHHYPEPFRAVGASTAVFGALGILTGLGALDAATGQRRATALLVPLFGGLTMLAWLGTGGGPQVDVVGHCAGFGAGLLLGLGAGLLRLRRATAP